MPVIAYKKFSGEIPNCDPQLLPEDRAQLAQNCEFAHGSLRPIKDGLLVQTMANNPVKGIYTDDGLSFYTWAQETYAFKGPTIDDLYNRVYFLTPADGNLKVTTATGMAYNGPSPSAATTWRAGVPKPTVAPVLTLLDRSTIPNYDTAILTIEAWWEYAGNVYDKTSVTLTDSYPLRKYVFEAPGKTAYKAATAGYTSTSGNEKNGFNITTVAATAESGTPTGAVLVAKIVFTESKISGGFTAPSGSNVTVKPGDYVTNEIMSGTVKAGQTSRSMAFPGGVEFGLSLSGTTATMTLTWGKYETRAYTYTYRNTWNEEGAPSPASTISTTYIEDVVVTVTAGAFTGYRPFQDYKLYRTYGTGSSYLGTSFSQSGTALTDTSKSSSIVGSALESIDWTPAPTGLQGLILMPNGWFAAFKSNMLYMSEPYRPHAFPYSMSFSRAIRGISVAQQSIIVTTADGVHVVAGATPASAQPIKINQPQAGISQRSMAQVDGAVAYASNDGIVFVSGADASLAISQKLFTRIRWREMYGASLSDASLTFGYYDGSLVATSKSMDNGFTLKFDEDIGEFSRLSKGYESMFYLPVEDSMYYTIGPGLFKFKAGESMPVDWWGKDWIFPSHATFGAGFMRADGPATLKLYADDALVFSGTVSPGYFRLPSLPRSLRWSVRLGGANEINEFYIAQAMAELKLV